MMWSACLPTISSWPGWMGRTPSQGPHPWHCHHLLLPEWCLVSCALENSPGAQHFPNQTLCEESSRGLTAGFQSESRVWPARGLPSDPVRREAGRWQAWSLTGQVFQIVYMEFTTHFPKRSVCDVASTATYHQSLYYNWLPQEWTWGTLETKASMPSYSELHMLVVFCLVQHLEHPGHHAAETSADAPQVAASLQEYHIWSCLSFASAWSLSLWTAASTCCWAWELHPWGGKPALWDIPGDHLVKDTTALSWWRLAWVPHHFPLPWWPWEVVPGILVLLSLGRGWVRDSRHRWPSLWKSTYISRNDVSSIIKW